MTHTSGPWHIDGVYGEGPQRVMRADRVIASIWQHFDHNNKALEIATDLANARLIAAAPRMYDYIAMRASLSDNIAKNLLKELGYAEGEISK